MEHYAYIYRDPRPNKNHVPVYVGKGKGGRSSEHWALPSRCKNRRLSNLLALLRREGLEPIIEIVEWFNTDAEALAKEVELITLFGRVDLNTGPLYNLTAGGEGLINISSDALDRRSASIKKAYNTPARRKAQSERSKKAWANPEFRAARLAQIAELSKDPEHRKKLSKAIRKAHANPEVREKISVASKERWQDPEYRELRSKSMQEAMSTPEAKAVKSAATKAGWDDEVTRKRRTKGIKAAQTPEMIARRSETNKENWTEEKRAAFAETMKAICADPEHKKRRSEAAKAAWAKRKNTVASP